MQCQAFALLVLLLKISMQRADSGLQHKVRNQVNQLWVRISNYSDRQVWNEVPEKLVRSELTKENDVRGLLPNGIYTRETINIGGTCHGWVDRAFLAALLFQTP
jgi:hypothetical protein